MTAPGAGAPFGREYPSRPIVGVGGVVFVDGRVLLVKRRFEPLAGRWSLPGGALEVGETLAEGLAREMQEETGLDVDVGPVVEVFDRIIRDEHERPRFHYVLVDFLCTARAGAPVAGSDVAEVVLAETGDLARYELTAKTVEIIGRARRLAS
ncbi:MAG: NUDIX domain-containing protein [Vicinamibacterales bacterium]